ncbi:MAG TPA: aromatic-ring-hydroxylating dioxygenase subunit beta [Burkholderiaceae bacterium]|nr:aromatic-ring-hydroxylating dioxygenase subunit beta [Burkholderiaceae bacterium]
MAAADVTREQLIDLVLLEARLLDETRYDKWNALFADDGIYWVPLEPDQPEGPQHTSHLYEDKLLRDLRVERLKSPRAFSQQPRSRSHHLLQQPSIEAFEPAANRFVTRCQFHYTEAQADEINFFVGTVFHHFAVRDGALRITLKRVNLLNSDAALPAVQLFI